MRPRSGAKTVRRVLPTRMTLFLKPLLPDSYPAGVFAIPQRQGWLRVGRGQGNDLRVNHDSVSANHAKIFVSEETGTILSDCGSSNGTFVNGVQVSDRFPISVGDLVRFATAEFQVVADASGNLEEEATARIENPESAARILVLESELEAMRSEVETRNHEKMHMMTELDSSRSLVAGFEVELQKSQAEGSALGETVRGLQREILDHVQREQRNQSTLSETRKTLMDREGAIAGLQYEISKRDRSLQQLTEERDGLQRSHHKIATAFSESQEHLESTKSMLSSAIEEKKSAEGVAASLLERLISLSERLLADWEKWRPRSLVSSVPSSAEEAFEKMDLVAAAIRSELDLIEPIWHEFGDGVQEELRRRCARLQEEEADLSREKEERQVEVADVSENLEQFRQIIDSEVRRAQGLSRRGVEVEIPERFESMVIAKDTEQEIYRSLIERLEVMDLLIAGYRGSKKLREIVIELDEFRARLAAILEGSGVCSFTHPVGMVLTLKHRKEVQVLSRKGWGTRQYSEYPFQPGEITKVIRAGYSVGEGEYAVILRKVEVLIRGIGD
jgi:pSer/pThr/pTyr-binding forkhead associated (FHA) protein